jgi:endoglucanase
VTYHVDSSWNSGFNATVTLKDTGSSPLTNWSLTWTEPGGVQIVNGWNATVSQNGATVTAKAPTWAPTLAAGASASIGFQAGGSSSGQPTGYTVDGTTCGVS